MKVKSDGTLIEEVKPEETIEGKTIDANEVTGELSDGRKFVVRRAKTKDLLKAQRQAGLKDAFMTSYYLVADLTTIEGQPLICEDLLEMPMEDFETLSTAATEKQGKKPGE